MLRVENPSRFLLHEHFSWILTVYRVRPAIVWQFQGSSLRFVILSTFHIIFSITLTNFGSRLATQSVNAMALTLLEYNQCTYKLYFQCSVKMAALASCRETITLPALRALLRNSNGLSVYRCSTPQFLGNSSIRVSILVISTSFSTSLWLSF
jgi:hypothetical protein